MPEIEDLSEKHINRPPMKYTPSGHSVLIKKEGVEGQPGLKTYNLADKELRNNLHKMRAGFYKKATEEKIISNNPTVIHYDSDVFTNVSDLSHTLRTRKTVAQEERQTNSKSIWRFLTKHRSVTSKVQCFGDGYGNDFINPIELTITTGCTANLMHDKGDLSFYLKHKFLTQKRNNQYKLTSEGEKFFKQQVKLQFKRWLHIQNEQGVQVVIFPMVGGGVYLKKLDTQSKENAKSQIHSALVEALNEFNAEFRANNQKPAIEEVIYTLPDGGNESHDYHEAVKATNKLKFPAGNDAALTIANGDMFDIAKVAFDAKKKVGGVSAGSDRTIGGDYFACLTPKKDEIVPLEETICHLTNLLEEQNFEFGKINGNLNNYTLKQFPAHLKATDQRELAEIQKINTQLASTSNINTQPKNKQTTFKSESKNFSSRWSTNEMEALNHGAEWKALKIQDKTKTHGVLIGQNAQGTTNIVIGSSEVSFSFPQKKLDTEVETVEHVLRLLIAGRNGANYEKDDKDIVKLKLTPTEDSDPTEVAFIQAVAKQPEFSKFIEIESMPKPAPVQSMPDDEESNDFESDSDDEDEEDEIDVNNNAAKPKSPSSKL